MSGPTSHAGVAEAGADITTEQVIALAGNTLVHFCHQASRAGGWWTDPLTGQPIDPEGNVHLVPAKLMLVVSEVAEAMEGHRKGLMDAHLPHRQSIEVELADAVIRICDLAGALGLDLGPAIVEKMAYNAQRADHKFQNRLASGGKAY